MAFGNCRRALFVTKRPKEAQTPSAAVTAELEIYERVYAEMQRLDAPSEVRINIEPARLICHSMKPADLISQPWKAC